ncbi:hypothetical protein RHGRI_015417 [Rhododendron griersonianum]|uniref:Uncharacterized protein n=1 Tax=Rhododendron griersonianum TaxID=479676 RepID=A0AAV6KDM4_9ERIC|nr:hypothetical protein RHGRI_015417 [Rhododendron griersonianum]
MTLPTNIDLPEEQRKLININFCPSISAHRIQISSDIALTTNNRIKQNPNQLVIISTGMEAKPKTFPLNIEFAIVTLIQPIPCRIRNFPKLFGRGIAYN